MPLNNFGIVIPGKLYRCAQPEPPHGYDTLEALGVDMIFQLNGDADTHFWKKLLYWKYMQTFQGFQQDALDVTKELATSLDIGRVCAVHCTHGRDRTGLIIAAYQILYLGYTFEQAQADRLQYGSQFVLEVVDSNITAFLKTLKP